MRNAVSLMSALALAVCLVDASTAASLSRELRLPIGAKSSTCTNPIDKGGVVPNIARGAQLGITCSEATRDGVAVRVVMQIDLSPGETPTGIGALLATEQTVEGGMVHVKVPNLPDLANHTVDVKVYVTDSAGTHSCDAGRVKIM